MATTKYNICSKAETEREVAAFKESLKIEEAIYIVLMKLKGK